jgi:diaminopropionate ammonia-lyase
MAGLNCETPSLTAWPAVRDRFDAFVSIEDRWAREAMRCLAAEGVVSGESGAAGLAALIALCKERPDFLSEELHLLDNARILVINTEADTDPDAYRRIVSLPGI